MSFLGRISELLEGKLETTWLSEWKWRTRHLYKGSKWAQAYCDNISHPHRSPFIQRLERHAPFKRILEIGCATGPNLVLLARKFPDTDFHGIDVNPHAIRMGKKWAEKLGLHNIRLYHARAQDLLNLFPANPNFDVIFSDASLIYVAPDKIESVLSQILIMCRKAILHNEWYEYEREGACDFRKSFNLSGHWVHDYPQLYESLRKDISCHASHHDHDYYRDPNWKKYGAFIEALP